MLRLVSLGVIVAALLLYNGITKSRLEAAATAAHPAATASETTTYVFGDSVTPTESNPNASAPSGAYKDGTYEGEAQGYGGLVKVSVVVSGGAITSVGVLDHSGEDDAYWSMAEALIPKIIEAQSTGVDTVTGATFSSNGILNGVDKALEGAVN